MIELCGLRALNSGLLYAKWASFIAPNFFGAIGLNTIIMVLIRAYDFENKQSVF